MLEDVVVGEEDEVVLDMVVAQQLVVAHDVVCSNVVWRVLWYEEALLLEVVFGVVWRM